MAYYDYYYVIGLATTAEVLAQEALFPNGVRGLSVDQAIARYAPTQGAMGGALIVPYVYVVGLLDATMPSQHVSGGTIAGDTDAFGNHFPDHTWEWVGVFQQAAGTGAPPASPEAISQRRWIDGFELPEAGEGGSAGSTLKIGVCRDASRTPDGMGVAFRNQPNVYTHGTTENTGGGASAFRGSWERIYLRVRRLPIGNVQFWRCHGTSSQAGVFVKITPTGGITITNRTAAIVDTVIGTVAGVFTVNVWARIDIVVRYNDGSGNGHFRIWKNGTLLADILVPAASAGLGTGGFHETSDIGEPSTANELELDYDDWTNADEPILFTGIDWRSGSHIRAIHPRGFGTGHGAWVGNYRVLLQNPAFSSTQSITSSTSADPIVVTTDANLIRDRGQAQGGCVAVAVGVYSKRGANSGSLGYSIAGAAAVTTAILEFGVAYAWSTALYRPSGMITPAAIEPLNLKYIKGTGADAATVQMLMAVGEYLGTWGAEDTATITTFPAPGGIHNAPYSHTRWTIGQPGAGPRSPVVVQAGIYIGNNVGQDLLLAAAPHWYWLRPITGQAGGAHWWSSIVGTHVGTDRAMIRTDPMPQALLDTGEIATMRIAGGDSQGNANTIGYQYVMISDPGARFLINGAFAHYTALATAVNPIADTAFLPEAAFLFAELMGTLTPVAGLFYKGRGHAPNRAQKIDGAETTNTLSFATGQLISETPLHVSNVASVAYSAWRRKEPCRAAAPEVVVEITSYIGDGTASRVVALDLNTRWPLFVLVVSHATGGFVRDPSHVGVNSSDAGMGGFVADAIMAGGSNSITVGISCNVLNVIYEVFCIPGSATAWANGTYYPVDASPPCAWPPTVPTPTPTPTPGGACAIDFPTGLG